MRSNVTQLRHFENRLHEDAIRDTGLDDFGDPAYRVGLRVLLEAFDADLQLTEAGWKVAYDRILPILVARLYAQDGWTEHPELLGTPIHRPIVITGLPRSGTTALHRLISVDPQFQGLETWLLKMPMIRPPRDTWESHLRYRRCVANLEALNTDIPYLRRAHAFVAFEVEECTTLLMQSFVSMTWAESYVVPTYARWLRSMSCRESYLRHADILRLIGARDVHRRWLLKTPHHMSHIDTLLEVFPDACIIQTHRDPLKVIPSVCSLATTYWQGLEGKEPWRERIGWWKCTHWKEALDRVKEARRRSASSRQFFDVDHRDFVADPLGVVRAVYDYFGLALSVTTERQMNEWIMESQRSKDKHNYAIDSCGVTEGQICEIFSEYRQLHQFK